MSCDSQIFERKSGLSLPTIGISRVSCVIPCLVALLALQAGCGTPSRMDRLEQDRTSLVVVEVEGVVQMSWNSSTDRRYTILYTDSINPRADQWSALSNYVNLRGTGRTMTAQDRLPPGVNRQYRLRSSVL